ncbi:MAG TPA: peptidylprolyl isomerase [Sulfurovum sp.]|nr:MAG: peptidylprolyl isomerase [Sulfurovum sp. 35-42-20]OYY55246.1 MAG: peptidylprolyl isomerase [Sulfurovum sp. 28-43-6]OYZ25119.1 MAG: peptidylprolyl isomerase [Sulfurovum sp. 16-42-52]OZA42468.1 MAG: peptidylprolyl isomerase [Sulfurovum sp. 17-42-90]OZA60040.1 MAG: peptidylprolyl isomerase [Sulfurovum sp. 39-42-12]HQR73100.1 peptidylprolyl isomerase [Sulfurovum sp.]
MLKLAKTSLLAVAVMASSVAASDILATVNGKNITKEDAQAFVTAAAPNSSFMQLKPQEQRMVTDRLVEKELFTELAAKEGFEKKPEFQRNMEKLKNELLVNMWMKAQMDSIVVSDGDAKAFYDKNSAKFMQQDSMHARHILVKDEKEAQAIIDSLKSLKGDALKTKFIEVAQTKSTGPSGPKGGDLGTFAKGQMVPEFSDAAWALEVGQITTKPVKTQFGYHVIFLEEKTPAKPTSYDEVKDKILTMLKQQQFTAKVGEIAKELKSKAKIENMLPDVNATQK